MRRGNGDGSIYKLSGKRRNPYAVRVTIGWSEEGKQMYKYVGFYPSKTEAKKALNEYLLNPKKQKLERVTLKSVFENMIQKSKFSEGTIEQYQGGFRKMSRLHNVNIADIELWQLEELFEGQGPSAQARIKKTLSNCYKYAMKHDYVDKNLANFLEPESAPKANKQVFTLEQIERIWDDSGAHGDIPLILLYTGLRISELLELKIEHVDLKAKTINVVKSKTAAGVRLVPIHDKIMPLIEQRYDPNNQYLITHNNKRFAYSTFLREYWNQPRTPHECRHTFITYLTKCSDDILAIKKIVGHATSDITEHYTHRSIDELYKVINKLEYK